MQSVGLIIELLEADFHAPAIQTVLDRGEQPAQTGFNPIQLAPLRLHPALYLLYLDFVAVA